MDRRFRDSASSYRIHRQATNEAEAIAGAIGRYTANELGLTRSHLRLLDAGAGDGRVLKGVLERIFQTHKSRPCEVVLKEYDFHHIEVLLQNMAPMLRAWPQLVLFVTNRAFRHVQGFPADLCRENTVCFDGVAEYRLLAMTGASSLLGQGDTLLHSFTRFAEREPREQRALPSLMPHSDLWEVEHAFFTYNPAVAPEPALRALGDEIRAREIYDEVAAAGGDGKHFTVTIARRQNARLSLPPPRDFFWDLAIVSHAFNRDRDAGWVFRNILGPLCRGLSVGGVLVNVHATEEGQAGELKREIFGSEFPFCASPRALARALQAGLESEQFELLPPREFSYQARITAEELARLGPWEREMALHRLAISVAYHLQIPDEAWAPREAEIQAKTQELLEREGIFSYCLSIAGVKRRE